MFKTLLKAISELKTPERKLLFGVMFAAIVVLWASFRSSYSSSISDLKSANARLEVINQSKDSVISTQRAIYQEKLDRCNDEKIETLRELLIETERMKSHMKKLQ